MRSRSIRRRLSTLKRDYQRRQAVAAERLWADYLAGAREAVETYVRVVLTSRPWPAGFGSSWLMRYWPQSRQLDVEYELPGPDVAPRVRRQRYLSERDAMVQDFVPEAEVRQRYASVVAQTALRVLFDLFGALDRDVVDMISFNGQVWTNEESAGQPVQRLLVSLTVTRQTWTAVRLGSDNPQAHLRVLNALMSFDI
jgi:restriction system protein